ncbi:MAG: hypothetical protein ACREOZ_01200, partial [Gloeomargaritales cyanobacterium]
MDVSHIFKGLYDIHMARNINEATLHEQRIINEWRVRGMENEPMRRFVDYFVRQWIDSNFSKWRSADGPRGYAKTNNPLEQYHKSLKGIMSLNKNTNMMGMLNGIISAINVAVESATFNFNAVSIASRRLRQRHSDLRSVDVFQTTQFVGNANPNFHVLQQPLENAIRNLTENEIANDDLIKKMFDRIADINVERIERLGMPESGWTVNTADHTCPCLIWSRDEMCLHVIEATASGQLPCPGVPRPIQQFASRNNNRNRRARSRGVAHVRSVRRRLALGGEDQAER